MELNTFVELSGRYCDPKLSDVSLILKNRDKKQVIIPAHRFMLAAHSPAFEGIFKGNGSIGITDTSAKGFSEFLQVFNLSKVNFATANIGEVLRLIDKYDVGKFYPTCQKFMEATLTKTTALAYHELALPFNFSDAIREETHPK